MAPKASRIATVVSFCPPELARLGDIALVACPAMKIQRRTFEKLVIEAQTMGFVEHIWEGHTKLVRRTQDGEKLAQQVKLPES